MLNQAAGVAAAAVATPAIAQSGQVKWRMTTSGPKTLDTIYGLADLMSQRIAQLLVPGTQAFDAVANSTVECGHTLTAFYVGKNPAYAFDSGVAFGTKSRPRAAWVAKYYYTPGWWEGSAMNTTLVNAKAWEGASGAVQGRLRSSGNEQNLLMQAKYDAVNPDALPRLVGGSTELRAFP